MKDDENDIWSASYDFAVYSSDIEINKLPNSNCITLLEWLCYQFHMFISHPSMSKAAFTHNLQVQNIIHNDRDHAFPSTYHDERRLVDLFIVKKRVFSVCPNDCVIFRNDEKYYFGKLEKCPICDASMYMDNAFHSASEKRLISRRKFILYVPIGPRLARTFGDVNLAQLVQSHPGC